MSETGEGGLKKFKVGWRGMLALMVTILVIGVVALSSYGGDYTHRAQNAEAISLLGGMKVPLREYFEGQGKWPEDLDKITEITSGKFTKSVGITKGAGGTGEIELTATMDKESGVDRRVRGRTILMVSADGGKTWTCKPGTMSAEDLPVACRPQKK